MAADSRKPETNTQIEDVALLDYLDSLLREATETDETDVSPRVESVAAEPVSNTLLISELRPDAPVIIANSLEEIADTPHAQAPEQSLTESTASSSDWVDGRPAWAQSRFEVLLFEMHGVKFAAPLIELGLIHNIDRELTKLAGHPDWVAGILPMQGRSILVVDTLKALMPDKAYQTNATDYKYVITINNSQWGLACSKLIKTLSMEPQQVKWRPVRGSRTWLVGTVLDQMCSMVEVKVLAQGFDRKTQLK